MSLHPIKLKYAASHHSSNFSEAKVEKGLSVKFVFEVEGCGGLCQLNVLAFWMASCYLYIADALTSLPHILQNGQVEGVVKSLTAQQDHEKISNIIALLTSDYALSPQANHRKVWMYSSAFFFSLLFKSSGMYSWDWQSFLTETLEVLAWPLCSFSDC